MTKFASFETYVKRITKKMVFDWELRCFSALFHSTFLVISIPHKSFVDKNYQFLFLTGKKLNSLWWIPRSHTANVDAIIRKQLIRINQAANRITFVCWGVKVKELKIHQKYKIIKMYWRCVFVRLSANYPLWSSFLFLHFNWAVELRLNNYYLVMR